MFGSVILDVGIGLVFLYSLLALACSGAAEVLEANLFNKRSKHLKRGVGQLLGSELVQEFWAHPLVKGSLRRGKAPSYLSPRLVALVLVDLAGNEQRVEDLVKNAPDHLKGILVPLARAADQDMNRLIAELEAWFDHGMQRVSGWYKRHTQLVILFLGLGVAGVGNVDSLHIARALYADASLRAVAVSQATAFLAESASPPPFRDRRNPDASRGKETFRNAVQRAQALDLPIGWLPETVVGATGPRIPRKEFWPWVTKILGIVLTGLAASLGAPFWFDLLGRIATLRTSLRPGDSKAKEESKAKK